MEKYQQEANEKIIEPQGEENCPQHPQADLSEHYCSTWTDATLWEVLFCVLQKMQEDTASMELAKGGTRGTKQSEIRERDTKRAG